MGASGLSPWLLWALIGFGPSAVVLCLGMRALRRDTGSAWADFSDINTLLDWITPGLTVVAYLSLARMELSRCEAAIFSAGPMITYIAAAYIPMRLYQSRQGMDIDRLTSARLFISGNDRLLAITIMLVAQGLRYSGFGALMYTTATHGMPTLSLFVSIVIAGWLGEWILGRLAPGLGEWKALAPGELYKRVIEIASKAKVEVDDVRILRRYPDGYIGAIAHSESSIVLGEELVTKLNKDEVGAVIAHEVGHLGDTVVWQYSYPAYVIAGLAWYAAVKHIERMIMSAPDLRYLQYLNWMAMFIVPGLVVRWYSRYCERKADANIAVLDNPGAAISGFYKLSLLTDLPLARPWWSRMLSTHPDTREDIGTIARRSGLTAGQVDEIRRRAEAEVESGEGERYELIFHEESESEIEKRGNRRVEILLSAIGIITAVVLMTVVFWQAAEHEHSGWVLAGIIIVGVLATALAILIPIDLYNRRKNAGLRDRIRNKLAGKYGDECAASMLLVDARTNQDEDLWQGALIGIRDGALVVLGETREVHVPLDAGLAVERFTEDNSFGEGALWVIIWYEVDSVRQWIVVRILGRPEKGLPRNQKDLERHIRDLITGSGGEIREKARPPVRQVLIRAPIALLVLAATFGLVYLLSRLADLEDNYVLTGFALLGVATALYAWVTQRPDADT